MFAGYKTYITAALAALTAVGAYFTGDATLIDTIQHVFEALMVAFVRSGIAKIA